MDDHAILMELGRITLKGVAQLARLVDGGGVGYLRSLDELISPQLHKKFLAIFFNDEEPYYFKLINLINILPTWQRAISLLHLFYSKKGIDPLSKEAMEFSNLVYLRYFPDSKFNSKKRLL